jgi:hypothetical protein
LPLAGLAIFSLDKVVDLNYCGNQKRGPGLLLIEEETSV